MPFLSFSMFFSFLLNWPLLQMTATGNFWWISEMFSHVRPLTLGPAFSKYVFCTYQGFSVTFKIPLKMWTIALHQTLNSTWKLSWPWWPFLETCLAWFKSDSDISICSCPTSPQVYFCNLLIVKSNVSVFPYGLQFIYAFFIFNRSI